MIIQNHYLNIATQIPSPNCDYRPNPYDISLIVIHCISLPAETFGGDYIDQLFTNQLNISDHPSFAELQQLKVSAHCLIRRDGSIKQYVPFNLRAWHAGVSCYQGRELCNDFSIGIELEGSIKQAYTDIQYLNLAELTRILFLAYPSLSRHHIAGHSDIAPDRKLDPGPLFDWERFYSLLG